MDAEDGYIRWTGIWKGGPHLISPGTRTQLITYICLSSWKLQRSVHSCCYSTRVLTRGSIPADSIKMIESQPELAGQIRKVRGGYLKIQGTWISYEVRAHSVHIACTRLTLTFTVRTSTVSSVCWALMYLRTATCFDCTHDSVAFAIRFDLVPLFGCVLSLTVSNST